MGAVGGCWQPVEVSDKRCVRAAASCDWIFHISTCLSPLPLSNSHPRMDIPPCGVWGWVEGGREGGWWGVGGGCWPLLIQRFGICI